MKKFNFMSQQRLTKAAVNIHEAKKSILSLMLQNTKNTLMGYKKLILQNTNLKIITVAKIMAYNTLL